VLFLALPAAVQLSSLSFLFHLSALCGLVTASTSASHLEHLSSGISESTQLSYPDP